MGFGQVEQCLLGVGKVLEGCIIARLWYTEVGMSFYGNNSDGHHDEDEDQ